ncbi:hypothetical protein [Hoeflea alexandrii]|uniref:SMODS and SLOG-associating 2TM effector domain-containing protein n=1 Tax=Hoeflea alexandrii TaxID=288436 RepID=A0ABT1CKS3_9HYPH|nr:hypothetical protein [Hoeflea alexandrii]MCO6406777.1 hypothetical protein [Hoeflea alexandrii]
MPSATIEFTVGQYQSAFQLAAALNFGLSIFRQLRQPSQEAAISQANSVLELARRSSDWADSKMRAMEEAAKNKCVEAGGNPDTEFVIYLDQKGYDLATQKMVDTAELENDVLQVSWEIDKKRIDWNRIDETLEWSAMLFFVFSIFCLGYATYFSNINLLGIAANASNDVFLLIAVLNFLPVFASFALAAFARFRLSDTRKKLRCYERRIVRLEFKN